MIYITEFFRSEWFDICTFQSFQANTHTHWKQLLSRDKRAHQWTTHQKNVKYVYTMLIPKHVTYAPAVIHTPQSVNLSLRKEQQKKERQFYWIHCTDKATLYQELLFIYVYTYIYLY